MKESGKQIDLLLFLFFKDIDASFFGTEAYSFEQLVILKAKED